MTEQLFTDQRVRLDVRRCYECGRWWAYESYGPGSAECPVCARRTLDRLINDQEKLNRTINALRGALTRAKAGEVR